MIDKNKEKELVDLFKSPIKSITQKMGVTVVEFENGTTIPLYGQPTEVSVDIERCSFCKLPSSDNEPLFTINDDAYICKDCAKLAIKTFLQNGIEIDLEIGEVFTNVQNQLEKVSKNMEKALNEGLVDKFPLPDGFVQNK